MPAEFADCEPTASDLLDQLASLVDELKQPNNNFSFTALSASLESFVARMRIAIDQGDYNESWKAAIRGDWEHCAMWQMKYVEEWCDRKDTISKFIHDLRAANHGTWADRLEALTRT